MKSIFVTFICVTLSSIDCLAQGNSYTFTYDANGNRETRTIDLNFKSATNNNQETIQPSVYKENIEDFEITLFPNPTNGQITLEIKGINDNNQASINIYDFSGKLLEVHNKIEVINYIDLSQYSNGTYILRILIDKKISEWTVIKK